MISLPPTPLPGTRPLALVPPLPRMSTQISLRSFLSRFSRAVPVSFAFEQHEMKWHVILGTALLLLQQGCACTRIVDRLGETRINVSQPRCVYLMSDGSLVAEASLRHERRKDQALVREDPRYFHISASTLTTQLAHANSRGEVSIALTRVNTTMHPDTINRCAQDMIVFPVQEAVMGTYTNKHGPTGVIVPYDASGRHYRVEVDRSFFFAPTYKSFGYRSLSYLLYVPAVIIDTLTFPVQAATWRYGPGP